MRLRTLLAVALPATAAAQNYTEIIRDGDPVPGSTAGDVVDRIDNVDVNNNGDYLIELDSTGDSSMDMYMLHNGVIIWQEGTTLGFNAPAGKEASSFIDVMDINDAGDVMFITPVRDIGSTSTNGYLLVWNGVTVIEDGVTPCNAPSLPAGTIWNHVNEAWQNNHRQLLVQGTVDLAASGDVRNVMLRMDLDAAGAIVLERKLAMEDEIMPGHTVPVQGFSASKGRQAINDNGECMWYVDADHNAPGGSTLDDSNVYFTDAAFTNILMWNEADPFPTDPADVFDHHSTMEIDLNDNGDWVFSGFDRGPSADDSWIFKSIGGVLTVLAHEGDPTPASIPGGWLTAGFGFGGVVPMSDDGDVLWFIDWDDPNTDIDTGLMFNDELFLHEGVSMLGGLIVDEVPNSDSEIAMSDDGNLAILEVVLMGGADAVFLAELVPTGPIGTNYCGPANLNSSGMDAIISAEGAEDVSYNNVRLDAAQMATNQFGYFINSMSQGFSSPPGSQGNLCVSGQIGRHTADVMSTGAAGEFSLQLDLTMVPTPGGNVAVNAGETWYWQAWFRDVNPGNTSNFTDGICITFQ